ncbi:MAG: hypothetical protein GWN80_02195, partial [Gammaproteobacteria bacterium]|nr:hypothetical protein [Gammaproteobacteria bacterium]NIS16469.1 hypothetical protein [candidate division Zixibacteria bacterium]NIW46981.1 hypothetical protein [Gammaproteobacteria bacterium]
MPRKTIKMPMLWYFLVIVCVSILIIPTPLMAGTSSRGKYWDVTPEPENPSPNYDSILYS